MTADRIRASILTGLTFAGLHPADVMPADVTLRPQETRMWCWAASGQMLMETADPDGSDYAQCLQANKEFQTDTCPCHQCDPLQALEFPPCAERGAFPDFKSFGFAFNCTVNRPLRLEDLQKQTAQGPVAFSWHWLDRNGSSQGEGGHMMVAVDVIEIDGRQMVDVLEPLRVCHGATIRISYQDYDSACNHSHWNDFFGLAKDENPADHKECRTKIDNSSDQPCRPAPKGPAADSAATSIIQQLMAAKSDMGRTALGLSEDSDKQPKAGRAIEEFHIGLKDLIASDPQADLSRLPWPTGRLIYPVMIGKRPASLLIIRKDTIGWHLSALEAQTSAENLLNLRSEVSDRESVHEEAIFEVRIPALNLFFLGYNRDRDLILTPLDDYRDLDLRRGVSVPARTLLPKLRDAAKAAQGGGPS